MKIELMKEVKVAKERSGSILWADFNIDREGMIDVEDE